MRRFSDFRDEAILHDKGALKGKPMNTAGDTTIFSKAEDRSRDGLHPRHRVHGPGQSRSAGECLWLRRMNVDFELEPSPPAFQAMWGVPVDLENAPPEPLSNS